MKNIPRIIGTYETGNSGPLLFITAAVHGNEPAGYLALEKVFEILHKDRPEIKGTVVGVTGNRKALQQNTRYIDEDLNRTWTEKNIEKHLTDSHEKKEMFALIEVLEKYPKKDFPQQYFLDCHTTSSDSEPYISVQVVNDNDEWAHLFPTYIIRGFSDIVDGSIDNYESKTGMTGFTFEAGQHQSKASVEHHIGMIWHAISYACHLNLSDLSTYPKEAILLEEKRDHRKTFEIIYRYDIEEGDSFKMEPGFENFQRIKKGELLAHHNGNPVLSQWDEFIFMPLYQSQGNDGFFVVKQVK